MSKYIRPKNNPLIKKEKFSLLVAVLNIFHDKTIVMKDVCLGEGKIRKTKSNSHLRSKPFIKDTNVRLHKHTV